MLIRAPNTAHCLALKTLKEKNINWLRRGAVRDGANERRRSAATARTDVEVVSTGSRTFPDVSLAVFLRHSPGLWLWSVRVMVENEDCKLCTLK